jgi:LPS-assembly protein
MRSRRLLPVLALLLLLPVAAWAKVSPKPGGLLSPETKRVETKATREESPVDIEADELVYEREAGIYSGHGNVEVTRGDFSLKADHARLVTETNDVVAWGNVVVREGEDVLECARLEVNLDTQHGKVYEARLFMKEQNFHITGKEAEKLGENRYRVKEGTFTTCDDSRPPWKFTVTELDVTLSGRGVATNPVFYAGGVPLLYLPKATFPVRRERQTGFLLPELSLSSQIGPEVRTAFYWAMTKDMDSTFYLDRRGDRGFKEGIEYRYALAKEGHGQLNLYYIDDQLFDKSRYAVFLQHDQKLPGNVYLKSNINYTSDRFYTRDFDEDIPQGTKIDSRSERELRSTVFGGKNWDAFSLLAETTYFQDLTKATNKETVQKLPQVRFAAHPQSLFGGPLFFQLDTSYSNFWREKGEAAQRWDLLPRLSYPTRLFNVLKVESDLGLRGTGYRLSGDPTGRSEGWTSRETLDTGVKVSTDFYRVYETAQSPWVASLFKVSKWMHTIEPTVGYRYSPPVNESKLPLNDDADRMPFTSQVEYGVTQRLLGKPLKGGTEGGVVEYAKLKIYQDYSLGDPFTTDGKKREHQFSNLRAELWMHLNPYLSVRGDTEFNPYDPGFDRFNLLVKVKDRREDAVQVEYRSTRDSVREINLHTRFRLVDPLYLYGSVRYNLLERIRVENVYGLAYQAQCWSAGISVEDINRSPDGLQKKELKVQFYFNLLGIGAVGNKPYFMKL